MDNKMEQINQQVEPIEISIFSKDNNEIKLKLIDKNYREITCENLIEKVAEILNIPTESIHKVFSLYLVSNYLELPLKESYQPFKILICWSDLLKTFAPKYHHLTREQIEEDQPFLSLQRNMFLDKSDEKKVENELILKLLYEEARSNVIQGRYSFKEEYLAAIQLKIDYLRAKDEFILSRQYFKENINQYVSAKNLRSTNGSFSLNRNKASLEMKVNNLLKGDELNLSLKDLYKKYLRRCRQLPHYGAAFYHGQTERTPSMFSSLVLNRDLKIWVAINYEGVHFIDRKSSIVLDSLDFDEFEWELAAPHNINVNPNSLPCLFIKLNDKSNQDLIKITQIFGKQAKLMDNTLRQFEEIFRSNVSQDMIDSTFSSAALLSSKRKKKSLNFCSCATFDKNGVCVKKQGSLKFINKVLN